MTIDYVPTFVSKTFEIIFKALTDIATAVSLDRLLGSKTKFWNKISNGPNIFNLKSTFLWSKGCKVFEISYKIAKLENIINRLKN